MLNNPPLPPPENRTINKIMWKYLVQPDKATDDDIIRRMRFACQVTEAADTEGVGVGRGQARFLSSSAVV